jgi:hypothetical protein
MEEAPLLSLSRLFEKGLSSHFYDLVQQWQQLLSGFYIRETFYSRDPSSRVRGKEPMILFVKADWVATGSSERP